MSVEPRNLIRIGTLKSRSAKDISHSRLGIGFEKLDRAVFDPEKAYPKLASLGLKWVRLQSGWQRTERKKGVYDFAWIDRVVNRLLGLGMIPWVCLCYGNDLYNEEAKSVFGAVGVPPIFTEEQRAAWRNYCFAFAEHFRGRVRHYEVWNEPDNRPCWKHGTNATELGHFTIETAKAVRAADPDAYLIGGVFTYRIGFLNEAMQTGMGDFLNAISYHAYHCEEADLLGKARGGRGVCDLYSPDLEIIQGESGAQSRNDGSGALRLGNWTPARQAKFLLRHLTTDLSANIKFTSYFSCVDMVEALNGTVGDKASYLDYGYFGVLGADFDENGVSTGDYTPKPSYYALQNLAALFADGGAPCALPVVIRQEPQAQSWLTADLRAAELMQAGFLLAGGAKAFAYWKPADLLSETYEGTVSLNAAFPPKTPLHLLDPMDGAVYKMGESAAVFDAFGNYAIRHIPVRDYPLFLIFGDLPAVEPFVEKQEI